MAKKLTPITEQYQHFVQELKESFWGDLYGGGQQALKQLLEAESERERQRYLMRDAYERKPETADYRNGSLATGFKAQITPPSIGLHICQRSGVDAPHIGALPPRPGMNSISSKMRRDRLCRMTATLATLLPPPQFNFLDVPLCDVVFSGIIGCRPLPSLPAQAPAQAFPIARCGSQTFLARAR